MAGLLDPLGLVRDLKVCTSQSTPSWRKLSSELKTTNCGVCLGDSLPGGLVEGKDRSLDAAGAVGMGVGVGVGLLAGEAEALGLGEIPGVGEADGVAVAVGVAVGLGVMVGIGVAVSVAV